jgi:hypothetical protein
MSTCRDGNEFILGEEWADSGRTLGEDWATCRHNAAIVFARLRHGHHRYTRAAKCTRDARRRELRRLTTSSRPCHVERPLRRSPLLRFVSAVLSDVGSSYWCDTSFYWRGTSLSARRASRSLCLVSCSVLFPRVCAWNSRVYRVCSRRNGCPSIAEVFASRLCARMLPNVFIRASCQRV